MTSKKLKPQTIIPQSLYAYRAADRQLKDVIEDMGRPGYVLVARQMGKTNLLLNAKRELQNSEAVFAYIDLSNKFENLRDCFRNIIDTAIDANFETLGIAREAVARIRRAYEETLPPHKEHEQELLALLRGFQGKLIVVLDEIDALGNVEFSDQLFAQIRSVYFSRANFPEYCRLTYILSGVAEPSEIIKNKNVSPFNIGEKIYLDDFTYEEYCNFLNRAELKIPEPAVKRIYHWTSGNPRLTWDICSSIEDEIILGNEATEELVDLVVKKLYLNNYDLPPVDHIRKLCEDNRDVRRAIVNIRAARYEDLTDSIRKRLYLAGVISPSEFSSQIVSIKNRIIDAALGEDWLADIDKKSIGLRRLGDEKFESNEFSQAVEYYQEYFDKANGKVAALTHYRAASSYYYLRRFDQAIKHYDSIISSENDDSASLLAPALYFASMCDLALHNFDSAIPRLERVKDMDSEFSILALVNLAGAYAGVDMKANSGKVIDISKLVIEAFNNKKPPPTPDLLCTAYWNIGEAYFSIGDHENAKPAYEKAWEVSPASWKASICLRLLSFNESIETRKARLSGAINNVIEHNVDFSESNEYSKLALDPPTLHSLLLSALAYDLQSQFDDLSNYTTQRLFPDSSKFKLWRDLADGARAHGENLLAKKLLTVVQRTSNNDPQKLPTEGLQLVLSVANPFEFGDFESAYLQRLEDDSLQEEIDRFTFFWITSRMAHAHQSGNFSLADRLLACAERIRPNISSNLLINYLAVDYVAMQMSLMTKRWKAASLRANKIIEDIPPKDGLHSEHAFFSDEELELIRKQATEISNAFPSTFIEPFVRGKKYGNNEYVTVIYKNGKTYHAKFKKVKNELEQGLCEILDTSSDVTISTQ